MIQAFFRHFALLKTGLRIAILHFIFWLSVAVYATNFRISARISKTVCEYYTFHNDFLINHLFILYKSVNVFV